MKYIKNFSDIRLTDIGLVGGKNASLGQMIADLSDQGVRIPQGFALTVDAYWHYMRHNALLEPTRELLAQFVRGDDLLLLKKLGATIRVNIAQGRMPDDIAQEIAQAYEALSKFYGRQACDVAVRSSATSEDLPEASFAGQQETFLNVRGVTQLIQKCKEGMASLFTDRAIVYRNQKGFDAFNIGISIGVQKMVRSDKACAGVAFSVDTETGFKDVVLINASYGLGEMLVKGEIVPDEYVVHAPTLRQGYASIIKKRLGSKNKRLVYDAVQSKRTVVEAVEEDRQRQWCLTDEEVLAIARMTLAIQDCYTRLRSRWSPMDIEWAKDGLDGLLYCVQARPETVHATQTSATIKVFSIKDYSQAALDQKIVVTGQSIGSKIATGRVRVVMSVDGLDQVREGDILVTHMTDPDWVPVMKRVAGIVTDSGGRTCHAAIVARELGIPAVVGTGVGTKNLQAAQAVTIDCSRGAVGYVYDGTYPIIETETAPKVRKKTGTAVMAIISDPESAFATGMLPVDGVGLARTEFIISSLIKVHPMAILNAAKIEEKVRRSIAKLAEPYESSTAYFVQVLASGIGMIAAGLYPRMVLVRFSDFKTNEYRNLIGGRYFEPQEHNPMLGLRGASRYYHELYRDAFALECAAVRRARDVFGLKNIALMIPFVRTVTEAELVIQELGRHGLQRGQDGLLLYMMVEIPANVLLIHEFSQLFDGFSIGSNDLTQLVLGIDRDNELLQPLFDERNKAVQTAIALAIEGAHKAGKKIGICGQAPSDYPELATALIKLGIDSISLNLDALVPFLSR